MDSTGDGFEDGLLRIGEAASLIGVHVRTLRRWEDAGRLVPVRTAGGHRRYTRADVVRAAGFGADGSSTAEGFRTALRPARAPSGPLASLATVLERRPRHLVRRAAGGLYVSPTGGWFRSPEAEPTILEFVALLADAVRTGDWPAATAAVAHFADRATEVDEGATYDEWFQFLRLLRAAVTPELLAIETDRSTDLGLLFAMLERESAAQSPRFSGAAADAPSQRFRERDVPPTAAAIATAGRTARILASTPAVLTAVVLSGVTGGDRLVVRATAGRGGPARPDVTLVDSELGAALGDERVPMILSTRAAEPFGLLGPDADPAERCLAVASLVPSAEGRRIAVVVLGVASGVVVSGAELSLLEDLTGAVAAVLDGARRPAPLERALDRLTERLGGAGDTGVPEDRGPVLDAVGEGEEDGDAVLAAEPPGAEG